MANEAKASFLEDAQEHFGKLRQLEASQSLFEVSDTGVLIYTRYSRQHSGGKTFYGLRKDDLRLLEGRKAGIAFYGTTKRNCY